jgi:hypothetical protein
MNVTILSANITSAPNKSGKVFQTADVAFKNNSFQGKIEGKKITQYSEAAFKVVTDPSSIGKTFEVTVEKKDGFNNWVAMQQVDAGAVATPPPQTSYTPITKAAATAAPRSTYETPEERAAKQVYIVRQSSIAVANNSLSVGAKTPPDPDAVIDLAKKFEAYVFAKEPLGGTTGFDDVPDFDSAFPQVE